jgi:TetR/AcrR family transcriptional repressor of nem operon
MLANLPHVEAQAFMAAVHGAMLSARAYGDASVFGIVMDPLLQRLAAKK